MIRFSIPGPGLGRLKEWGYNVEEELNDTERDKTILSEWANRMQAVYGGILPPTFEVPENSSRAVIEECVLPVCREQHTLAMMIGVNLSILDLYWQIR